MAARPPPAPCCSPWPGSCWRPAPPGVSRRSPLPPARRPVLRGLGTRPGHLARPLGGGGGRGGRGWQQGAHRGAQLSPWGYGYRHGGTPIPTPPRPHQVPVAGGEDEEALAEPPARSPDGSAGRPSPALPSLSGALCPRPGRFAHVSPGDAHGPSCPVGLLVTRPRPRLRAAPPQGSLPPSSPRARLGDPLPRGWAVSVPFLFSVVLFSSRSSRAGGSQLRPGQPGAASSASGRVVSPGAAGLLEAGVATTAAGGPGSPTSPGRAPVGPPFARGALPGRCLPNVPPPPPLGALWARPSVAAVPHAPHLGGSGVLCTGGASSTPASITTPDHLLCVLLCALHAPPPTVVRLRHTGQSGLGKEWPGLRTPGRSRREPGGTPQMRVRGSAGVFFFLIY